MGNLNEFNGIRSTIIDQGTPPAPVTISRNRTFIFGTAKSGPHGVPVPVDDETVEQVFGSVPLDQSFDTSVVRGYYEFKSSHSGPVDVALVRCGVIAAAEVSLYENTFTTSGDLAYSLVDNHPAPSMWLRYLKEGGEGNNVRVNVSEGPDGFPSAMAITLPDSQRVQFTLSKYAGAPGTASSVAELVNLINSHPILSEELLAGYAPLETTVPVVITALSGTIVQTMYDLQSPDTHKSYGDKLIAVLDAYQNMPISGEIPAGSASYQLAVEPTKDMDPGVPTINYFIRSAELEEVLGVTAIIAGASSITKDLYCKTVTGWDNGFSIAQGFALYVRRNGTTGYVALDSSKYTLDATTGRVTILETLQVGDRYFVTYQYKVSYTEAKYRSELVIGSDRSYFITGDTIVFGAPQPAKVHAYYSPNVYFSTSDVAVRDAKEGIIEFVNAANMPSIGSTVHVRIQYQPELPAATGKVLPGSVVQPGALSGGSDGRMIGRSDYAKAVEDALKSVDLYPRRRVIVMGMYLDDTVRGYNDESGLAEQKPLAMYNKVFPYIERASNLTNECEVYVPVRPLADLSQSSINSWLERLTDNSNSDLNRPANLIDGINFFRADAPVGVMIVSIGQINGGRPYFANPACIYGAYKAQLSYKESAVHGFLPGNVRDLGVKIFNAEVIAKLNIKRYTAAVLDLQQRFIWADAPTLAIKYRSQYDRQFVRDTIYLAVAMAREAAQPYIGKSRRPQYIINMKKDIGQAISKLVPDVIGDVFVDVVPTADGYITGRTKIRLSLTTSKEQRGIDIETTVTLV